MLPGLVDQLAARLPAEATGFADRLDVSSRGRHAFAARGRT